MKKIVSVLALSALVAGSLFAEVAISGNLRFGTNLFNITNDGKNTTYGFNDLKKGNWGDNMTFKFKGEKAGAEIYTKVDPSAIAMDYAFAWIQFGDSFKLYGGKKDTRGFINRVNPLDGNWWDNYCEYGKPGIHKDLEHGLDSGNVTVNNEGSKAVNVMAEYAISDSMNVRLTLFEGATKVETPFAGFNGAAQFDIKQDQFVLTFTAKVLGQKKGEENKNATTFGLFVNPIVSKDLNLLVGYTFANTDSFDDVAAGSAHGIDVRAAYKTGAITLSTLNNITIAGKDSDIYTWHTVGFAYKVSDILSAVGIQAKINSGKVAWTADKANSATMNFRPYVDLTAMKNCILSIGIDIGVAKFQGDGDPTITVNIPTVLRVKL